MASKKEEKELKKNEKKKTTKIKIKIKKPKKEEVEVLELEEDASSKKTTKNSKNATKTKKTKNKKHYTYGPIEFTFNFVSLVLVICVALYYGGRSFYYYSLQTKNAKETAQTLNGLVLLNNKLVKESSEGLHQDEDGFYFRGKDVKNYVWFANRMFRVMRVNKDNTVKLVTDDLVSSFMWGENEEYPFSNLNLWLTPVDNVPVSGVYYKTIPSPNRFIVDTKYTIDKFQENKVEYGDKEFKDKVTTITLGDYVASGGKSGYLNNGKLYFLLGYNEEDSNLYIEEDGSIVECSNMDGYGVRGVITLNMNIPVSQGTGSKKDPYVIDQGNDYNHVDSYVKLGNDVWKVFEDLDGNSKMYLNGYITVDGVEVVRNYSNYSNKFNYFAEDNLGYYLTNDYFNSLPYKDLIVDNSYPYGEMSNETGLSYPNVYNETYIGKMAMLNIFDYVSNNELSDFFRDNTGANMSTTQYAVLSNGLLEEAEVTDQKHIVPVISISNSSIKGGTGRIDDPYVVE